MNNFFFNQHDQDTGLLLKIYQYKLEERGSKVTPW